jgi:DNA transposition AAA+ family ATPase
MDVLKKAKAMVVFITVAFLLGAAFWSASLLFTEDESQEIERLYSRIDLRDSLINQLMEDVDRKLDTIEARNIRIEDLQVQMVTIEDSIKKNLRNIEHLSTTERTALRNEIIEALSR